jgi:hypothetical protein
METHLKKTAKLTLHLKHGSIAPAPAKTELNASLPSIVGDTPSAAPLPHERDESVGMTDGIPSAPVQQAYRDLARGLQDTDRGPVADRTYRKQK